MRENEQKESATERKQKHTIIYNTNHTYTRSREYTKASLVHFNQNQSTPDICSRVSVEFGARFEVIVCVSANANSPLQKKRFAIF